MSLGATAKVEVDPKSGSVERIEWSDGSVFTRKAGAVVEPKKAEPGVESKTKIDTGVQSNAGDLTGDWEATLFLGKSIWTLKRRPDGRYDAQQKDFGKATGLGVFADGLLKIEWETADGYAGIEEWRLNPALNSGKGKGIGVKRFTGEHDVTVVRLSAPGGLGKIEKVTPEKTGKTGDPNDLSGRWRENTGANAPIWTLKRIADGKYEVRQDVIGHPSTGCKGTAQMDNGILSIGWDQEKLKNTGGGKWQIDGPQTKANAGHYSQSFDGKDRRDYQCTVTRLPDSPAAELKLMP